MDLDSYLRRIGYEGPREPSAATLRSLHRQHLFTVPFENLDIHLGIPIVLDLDLLYEKIVNRHRGGFCYELNGLFAALLRELGYRVELLSGRVRNPDGGFGPEFDHMLLKVQLDEPWLVDVGFGDSFVDPIVFHAGGADQMNGYRYVVLPVGNEWQLLREDKKGQVPLYAFRDIAHQLGEYDAMCVYHQTSPQSHFTQNWIASRATRDGRISISSGRLIITRGSTREEQPLTSAEELRGCLDELFGLQLPDAQKLLTRAAAH